jgi:hypothetical protein
MEADSRNGRFRLGEVWLAENPKTKEQGSSLPPMGRD